MSDLVSLTAQKIVRLMQRRCGMYTASRTQWSGRVTNLSLVIVEIITKSRSSVLASNWQLGLSDKDDSRRADRTAFRAFT